MRFGMPSGVFAATALALAWSTPTRAMDVMMPGRILIVKDTKLVKVVAKPTSGAFAMPAPGGGGDPVTGGGDLSMFDTAGAGVLFDSLTAGVWQGLGNPPGMSGYKYKNTAAPAGGEVKVIILKEKVVKIIASDDESLNGPMTGIVGIKLSVGTTPDNYCAAFGGTTVENAPGLVKRRDAPAPCTCPFPCAGCNGGGFLNVSTTNSPDDCGDVRDNTGMLVTNINCGGLYVGGGGNSLPLPYTVPDQGSSIMCVSTCTGSVVTVAGTSSDETGSSLNCTDAGCAFGHPLAVPNPSSTPWSICLLNVWSASPSGTVDCSTGATDVDLTLSSVIFLTGDTSTDPASTIGGIQPCPLCSSGTCIGGPNNSDPCTPGTTTLSGNPAYPTSHDCPPDPSLMIGTIPMAFRLSSGTIAWSGTTATNDTGSSASIQNRVFAGYCRDVALPGGTGAFEDPAHQCWENGMAVNAACAGTYESCEQGNAGAFGPNGGANRTIVAIGNAMGIIGGPAPATLVSVFAIPPTFDPTLDSSHDLPGPGAVAIPVTMESCESADPCP